MSLTARRTVIGAIVGGLVGTLVGVGTMSANAQGGAKDVFWGPDGPGALQASSGASPTQTSQSGTPTAPPKLRRPAQTAGLQVWVDLVTAAGETKRVSPDSYKFKAGDKITLTFQSNQPGYLYVVNVGTSGKITPLFPSPARQQNNRLEAYTPTQLTSKLVFDNTPGVEQLLFALSDKPIATANVPTTNGEQVAIPLDKPTFIQVGGSASSPPKKAGDKQDDVSLALADLAGAKDLFAEDDGAVLTVVHKAQSNGSAKMAPLIVPIKLKHI